MATEVIEKWTCGTPTLEAGGTGRAAWNKTALTDSERVEWTALLDAGVQTSWNDYAKVVIPINEMAFHLLKSVRLQAYYTATTGIDMGVCVYLHNPANLDDRVEISHTPYTTSAAGWRELNYPTEPGAGYAFFYYGTVAGTPDTCPTAGTAYTWQNFQDDNIFGNWTIYKITLDYGYYTGGGTMDGCYLAKVFINGQMVPLGPKDGKHRRTVVATKTMLATAKTTDEVISESTTAGTDWDFAFGGTGYITNAIATHDAAITCRLSLLLFRYPPTGALNDEAANTNPVTADVPYYLGRIDFPAMKYNGTGDASAFASTSTTGNLPIAFDAYTIYGVLVQQDATATFVAEALTISLTGDMQDN